MPSIRQRFHLSPCSDFRSHFSQTTPARAVSKPLRSSSRHGFPLGMLELGMLGLDIQDKAVGITWRSNSTSPCATSWLRAPDQLTKMVGRCSSERSSVRRSRLSAVIHHLRGSDVRVHDLPLPDPPQRRHHLRVRLHPGRSVPWPTRRPGSGPGAPAAPSGSPHSRT